MTTPPSGGFPPQPPPYGYPPQYYGYPPPKQTNALAIVALVCAFVFAPLGILFGHLSLSQIKKTGEEGRGLAIAGLVIGYLVTVVTVLVIVASVVFIATVARELESLDGTDSSYPDITATPGQQTDELPEFKPPATLGSNCQYPPTSEPASKPAKPPRTGPVPTDPEFVSASMTTNRGNIGLQLDNAKAPCTVNNFASLAQQGFFDDTPCHRLTTSEALGVLQCGDPSGTGTGGPGYQFPNEYPTNQFRLSDPAMRTPIRYPRGTLAMANAGVGTNGSQFFLVYQDSLLPPTYTAFGTIDATGLATVDAIAEEGVADGSEDGEPAADVSIESIRLD
ncbi:peptidylprolyl isomerase [Mycolicibacterium celeriflavum]|uniref:Cyclophilin n=1 Tax=Mycolicibacterium celeriflavum TaxID=1249101 RepID=A0A1X0BYB3_MYCCF|nr:peptidylprolyl isomerase [Mycolicibacterium celeriflavum]MCV7237105.1 peptidylprolyl isomerase [Mycolicibacterium celeriflavum]ORA48747.1 cyclophilin [Mycolicibacterium celeriflavum]BBY42940.1 cyclophilin [Mycolicibacterium celeriflavum]